MNNCTKLKQFFLESTISKKLTVGAEVETQFVQENGNPATLKQTQRMFQKLVHSGWNPTDVKGDLVVEVVNNEGARIFYELGRHNIEVATQPHKKNIIIKHVQNILDELYGVAKTSSIYPLYRPILEKDEDVLVVPDERDQIWIELDGRKALNMLAYTSSVQFTFSVALEKAISVINQLNNSRQLFLQDFPQEKVWQHYIKQSHAKYNNLRYGGPMSFSGLDNYCKMLAENQVVSDGALIPFEVARNIDIPLFLRSVWWHFRMKKYDGIICVEIRPLARRTDDKLGMQLEMILDNAFC